MNDETKNLPDPDDLQPQNKAVVAVGSGAIFIKTEDGNFVVLTPEVAKQIAKDLATFALLAEQPAEVIAPTTQVIPCAGGSRFNHPMFK